VVSSFFVFLRSTGPRKILPGVPRVKIRLMLNSTSSAVSGLPSWKVTPDRRRITQSVSEPFWAVIDSASRYCNPEAWESRATSGSYTVMMREMSRSVTPLCGSRVSDDDPPVRPTCRFPP